MNTTLNRQERSEKRAGLQGEVRNCAQGFQLSDGRHLREQEAPHGPWGHVGEVTEHQVDVAGHKGAQEVHVAREAVELGEDERCADGDFDDRDVRATAKYYLKQGAAR